MGAKGASGVRFFTSGDGFRRSGNNQFPSLMAALRPEIKYPIGALYDIKMMFDHLVASFTQYVARSGGPAR